MNGPFVMPPPPCPMMIHPGRLAVPMYPVMMRGPALVPANDPVALWEQPQQP